jgi:hypothetical protein
MLRHIRKHYPTKKWRGECVLSRVRRLTLMAADSRRLTRMENKLLGFVLSALILVHRRLSRC